MTEQADPILVVGATGQQGGAVARELLGRGREVHALTRAPDSLAAKQLAAQGAIVVQGDLDDLRSIRRAMSEVASVFSVQTHLTPAGVEGEVRHGFVVAQAAKDVGVAHVVYSSVDGAERDSGIPHFESKRAIERRLQAFDVPTTILRPTMFMENLAAHARSQLVGEALVVRLGLRPEARLQMIATADIGSFAADAFQSPERYIGEALALAGDELTGAQIADAFHAVTGIAARYEQQPLEQIRAISADLALMWEWIDAFGYDRANIAALRASHAGLRTLPDWLEQTDWQATVVL
jgi:uncharacterized protein YbjT (DUF2867 family)